MSIDSVRPRKKVVLYNPMALFFDMPLALLAIGSVLDPERYEVVIIDARIEDDPTAKMRAHLPGAVCLGLTVLTGTPLRDALEMSEFAKNIAPDVPVIWGGWHTSLFPQQPLQDETCIDITVQGQGENTFRELVDRLDKNEPLAGLAGICYRHEGKIVQTMPRALEDMDAFAPANYDLIDVEAYWFETFAANHKRDPEELKVLMSEETKQDDGIWPTPPAEPIEWYFQFHQKVRKRSYEAIRNIDPTKVYEGRQASFTLRWIVAHVVEHDSYHGGQAVLMHEMWKKMAQRA